MLLVSLEVLGGDEGLFCLRDKRGCTSIVNCASVDFLNLIQRDSNCKNAIKL